MTKELAALHMQKDAIIKENDFLKLHLENVSPEYANVLNYLITTNDRQYSDILTRIIEMERNLD